MEKVGEILKRAVPKGSVIVSVENSEPEYKCSICHDAGSVHPTEDGKVRYDRLITCRCQVEIEKEKKKQTYLKLCALPAASDHMTFENFNTGTNNSLAEAKRHAESLASGAGDVKWLTLLSKVDRGKTHLAVAICRRWLDRGEPARYAFVPLLLKELRDGFELEGENSYRQRLDFLCKVGLLVLDDLGTENAKEWAREQIQTIVHYRGINGLPLMVTTNKPLGEMPIDPENRIASRLQRESWCRVVAIDAQEHRLGKAESYRPKKKAKKR